MANVNFPHGAIPIRHLNGGEIQANEYVMTDGQTIYRGDFVILTSSGTVSVATAGATNLIGVAAEYKTGNGQTILVYDDPNIVFNVQASGDAQLTNIGNNADIVATTGNTLTRISKHVLDSTNYGTSTAQLRVIGKVNEPNNEWGNYCDLEVVINEHLLKSAAGI